MARRIEKSRLYRPFYLFGLEKTQWLPAEDLTRLTNRSLRSLIEYAYKNVPYYHRVMKDRQIDPKSIRTADDLSKLPILTKKIIRDNFESLASGAPRPDERMRLRTGGSTGVPLEFYSTPEADARLWASMLRSRFWQGVVRTHRAVRVSGTIPERDEWGKNEMYFSAFDISEDTFTRVLREIRAFQPKYVTGYAGYLAHLSQFMLENGVDDVRPVAVETQSEMVFPHMREVIEDAFGCPVFDHYGCKETTIKACECSRQEGFHVAVENGIIETVKDGEQVNGETGSMLMTDFWNLAMPFIRYEVEDSGVMGEESCSCGRSLPLLRSILGRDNDVVTLADGKVLPGEFFPHILKDVTGIQQYQVVQENLESIIIRIVPRMNFDARSEQLLLSNLADWLGSAVTVEISLEKEIPLSPTGKHKIVESRVGGGR
jgi:phenylacetate-CoA ligase